jgi:hypothetical protein
MMSPFHLFQGSRNGPLAGRTGNHLRALAILSLLCLSPLYAQTGTADPPSQQPQAPSVKTEERELGTSVFSLLNMAGTKTAAEFTPLNQRDRNHLFLSSLVNPLSFVRVGFSAGLDQKNDKPRDWEQGGAGYGMRYGNIFGQYTIQRTTSFALSSALDEDNRYFNSGKHGIWRRTWYAVTSSVLARHRDGHRTISISQVGGVAAGAFVARAWLPPDQNSAGDGAVSFGISMAANVGTNVFKEFLPDIIHVFVKKPKSDNQQTGDR